MILLKRKKQQFIVVFEAFCITNSFVSNTRLKLAKKTNKKKTDKKKAKAKKHTDAELLAKMPK